MKEEFLFGNKTLSATTAADFKDLVDSFFEANELSWQNFKHICTEGVPTMIGIKSGFVTLVKNKWPHVTSSHCSLHRYTLASKTLPLHLMRVVYIAVKVISFICSRTKNRRHFQLFATKEMGAQHEELLFYIKVRWLSRSKCLSWLSELKNELKIFL